jgi:hypothetical protein
VFHEMVVLSRVIEEARVYCVIEKKSRKMRPKNNRFQNDERHYIPIMDYTITDQRLSILSNERHKIIDVSILPPDHRISSQR